MQSRLERVMALSVLACAACPSKLAPVSKAGLWTRCLVLSLSLALSISTIRGQKPRPDERCHKRLYPLSIQPAHEVLLFLSIAGILYAAASYPHAQMESYDHIMGARAEAGNGPRRKLARLSLRLLGWEANVDG